MRNEGLVISSAPLTDERGGSIFFLEMEGRGGGVGVVGVDRKERREGRTITSGKRRKGWARTEKKRKKQKGKKKNQRRGTNELTKRAAMMAKIGRKFGFLPSLTGQPPGQRQEKSN